MTDDGDDHAENSILKKSEKEMYYITYVRLKQNIRSTSNVTVNTLDSRSVR